MGETILARMIGWLLGILGMAFIVIVLVFYNAFAWGYVAKAAYGWFILPYFPNLPHFVVYQFVGFSFFINIIIRQTSTHDNIKEQYKDKNYTGVTNLFFGPWISLICGWLLHTWFF